MILLLILMIVRDSNGGGVSDNKVCGDDSDDIYNNKTHLFI